MIYNMDSTIGFGKYKGMTIYSIAEKDAHYIVWCICNLDHFIAGSDVIACLQGLPGHVLTGDAKELNEVKLQSYRVSRRDDYDDYGEHEHYEEFAGTYAQDEAGYSDEDIYDAFDGDPDAYWNID